MGNSKTNDQEKEDQLQVALSEFVSFPCHDRTKTNPGPSFDGSAKGAVIGPVLSRSSRNAEFAVAGDAVPGLRMMGF